MSPETFYAALPTKPRKAVTAFVTTLGSGVGIAFLDGALTRPEAGAAVGAALVAAFAVWRVPNPVDVDKLTRGPNPQQLPPEAYAGGPS